MYAARFARAAPRQPMKQQLKPRDRLARPNDKPLEIARAVPVQKVQQPTGAGSQDRLARPNDKPLEIARPVPSQQVVQLRWSRDRLVRSNESGPHIVAMAAGGSAAELFIADRANNVVRAFDVRSGQLGARDVYRGSSGESVRSVAYSAHTDTLFIGTWREAMLFTYFATYSVRSLARTNSESEWRECHRIDLQMVYYFNSFWSLRALSDGSQLVLGISSHRPGPKLQTLGMHLLAMNSSRGIRNRGSIGLSRTYVGFDAKLTGNTTWLAAAMYTPESSSSSYVALFRVVGDKLIKEPKPSLFPFAESKMLLFWRDSLLVYALNANANGWEVHELDTGGGRLKPRRGIILSGRFPFGIGYWDMAGLEWCVANDSLVAWNLEKDTLTIYALVDNDHSPQ